MAELSTIPDVVNIRHYGGDTLFIPIIAPDELVGGLEWLAQVRSDRLSTVVAATFDVVPPEEPGDPTMLVLPAATVSALLNSVTPLKVRNSAGQYALVMQYKGHWDVQVSGPGGIDPVTTLAQGTLTLDLDVSRLSA